MSKRKQIAIMQPTYMPWLGYFSMIEQVDEFIFLDNVQLTGRSWQVRNKIKLNDAERLLTIPVEKDLPRDERFINATKYFGENWKKSHLDCIRTAYKKAPYYKEVMAFLEEKYAEKQASIGDFTIFMIKNIARMIGIDTVLKSSSQLLNVYGEKDEMLVSICKSVDADRYLSAQGSAVYIEKDAPGGAFARNGIELTYQNYIHPEYKQLGDTFISHIGIYDLLFCEGFEKALEIIRSGKREDIDYMTFRKKYM